MAPKSQIQFIDTALSCNTSFALSYTDPDQKWLIRKHLISFLQDFPSFRLSFDEFTHNDGSIMNLLNANGILHISNSTPQIPITIWIHENYPSTPPIVIVSSDSIAPIRLDHPFIDPSGIITISYLKSWHYPGSNLIDLVRKLVKLFSYDHPFFYMVNSSSTIFTHPSFVSKNEAIDRLVGMMHYDVAIIRSEAEEEIEQLVKIQTEMNQRVRIVDIIVDKLEEERRKLKFFSVNLLNDVDVMFNWVRANDPKSGLISEAEVEYEGVDEDSEMVIHCLAASKSIDDLIYAMDKAFENGVVSFEIYFRQVRILAREQFMYKASLVKFSGHGVLLL